MDSPTTEDAPAPRRKGGQPRRAMGYKRSGFNTLRRTVAKLGSRRVVDKRTQVGRELARWREALVRDLGGDLSTQEAAIVDLAVRSKLLIDSVDTWLLGQSRLVNARKKTLLPVLVQRDKLAE